MPTKNFDLSLDLEKASTNVLATARKELQAAAKAHGVRVNADQMIYAEFEETMIVHALIAGIEKYKDADYQAGAPIQLLIVKSLTRGDIPNGSYVIKIQYRSRTKDGRAIFTDRKGAVILERKLIVRTWKQSADLFPEVYSDTGIQNLPQINSSHWFNYGFPKGWRLIFDAAGWTPYREIWYY
jgi:hypothetical protein